MNRFSLFLWGIVAIIGALFALFAVQLSRPKDEFVESTMIGKPVPSFRLPPASGDRPGLASADLTDGKAKLLNIFASWCIPCAAEAPQLAAIAGQGAPIVAVAIRDKPADVAGFLARYGNPYARIGRDDISEVQLAIGSSGVPETFVVDGKGIIRYQHIGDIRDADVARLVQEWRKAGGA